MIGYQSYQAMIGYQTLDTVYLSIHPLFESLQTHTSVFVTVFITCYSVIK